MELHTAKNGVGHEKTPGKIYAAMRIMYFCSRISILHKRIWKPNTYIGNCLPW